MEVVWNEGQHFGTVGEKLDKFSTFGGVGDFSVLGAVRPTRMGPAASGMGELFSGNVRILSWTYYFKHSICKQLWEKNRSFGICFRARWS